MAVILHCFRLNLAGVILSEAVLQAERRISRGASLLHARSLARLKIAVLRDDAFRERIQA
jgi:hypothetical protein